MKVSIAGKISIEDDIVTYLTAGGAAHEFDPLEFLALISCHVPKPYGSLTRYYGWYSSRARGERAKRSVAAVNDAASEMKDYSQPSSSWCACIKKIYEIDPLECPRCKTKTRIIPFIQDPAEISKIISLRQGYGGTSRTPKGCPVSALRRLYRSRPLRTSTSSIRHSTLPVARLTAELSHALQKIPLDSA